MHVVCTVQAFSVAEEHQEWRADVQLAHATFLQGRGEWEAAQQALHSAGQHARALDLLEALSHNAVAECRFHDASHYAWRLSLQMLDIAARIDIHYSLPFPFPLFPVPLCAAAS